MKPLISDSEDRRLFEEAKRTRAAFVSVRTRYLELVRQGKAEEHKKLLAEQVIPAYEESVKAIDANIDYNEKLGDGRGQGRQGGRRIRRPADRHRARRCRWSWPAS